MKKFTAIICTIAMLAALTACGSTENPESKPENLTPESSDTSTANSESISTTSTEPESNSSAENVSDELETQSGEPTFLIGLDGKPILTSEITRLEDTDKTAETLTKDDLWAKVHCEGFAYYKEPLNIGYNNYKNPELFDGFKFLGDIPENKNEWKRVYVGDEICGLKVKSASVNFCVNDGDYKFPERYVCANENRIAFEGTIEVEGFLEVNQNSVQYPESNGLMWFYPTSINLPIVPTSLDLDDEKGFIRRMGITGTYCHDLDYLTFGEFDEINLGNINDAQCNMKGIGTGDIAYVRVTLKDIEVGGAVGAKLENVELLSDILAHAEDETEAHQPAPVI